MDNENEKNNSSYYRFSEKGIEKRNKDLWKAISEHSKSDITFKEKFYLFENNLDESPKCYCNNKLKFLDMKNGYRKFCSYKCAVNSEEVKSNKESTCLNKYGVTNPSKSAEIKEKVKKTNLEKFGVEYPLQSQKIIEKVRKDFFDKWGVDNPSKVKSVREKARRTTFENFGVSHPMQSKTIKDSLEKYFLDTYGVTNPSKLPDIRKKASDSMYKLYGVTDALKAEQFRQKSKITNLKKWGKEYFTQTEDFKTITKKNKFLTNSKKVNDTDSLLLDNIESDYLIMCLNCNEEFSINRQLWRSRKRNNITVCLKCNPITTGISFAEKDLHTFISSIYKEEIIQNFKIKKELDIYLPKLKIGFEYNGLYWHSEAYKSKYEHVEKYKYFQELGLDFFTIWEDDWLFRKDIVISMIKSKVGLIENKIFARKCEIREIVDNNIIKNFLTQNHIQGFIGSKIKIGLYHNNELVSIMTFGELRKSLGQKSTEKCFELLRFCNKLNYIVVGGASRMLKYFFNSYEVSKVISYSDNSRSNGNLYKKLGFECISESFGNYFWYKNQIRYHRFTFRKDKLVRMGYDANKTEVDIMHDKGYLRVWDYGQKKWEILCKN